MVSNSESFFNQGSPDAALGVWVAKRHEAHPDHRMVVEVDFGKVESRVRCADRYAVVGVPR